MDTVFRGVGEHHNVLVRFAPVVKVETRRTLGEGVRRKMISSPILHTIAAGFLSVSSLMCCLWLIHLALKNAGVVDIGWGLGFIILSGLYFFNGVGFNLRNSMCYTMVVLWGLRISLFLIKRTFTEGREDQRYQKMRREWGKHISLKFLFFFEFQAVLESIIGVPFLIIGFNHLPGISAWEVSGAVIFGVALIAETVADEQLHHFKTLPSNKGKVCDKGLWRYSRHPNYFFEWLVWVGFFIYALGSPGGWISIISPAVMYILLVYVSGVPLAEEQSLKSRGEEYLKYRRSTSMFFPWPVKRMGI